ncbi:MAG: thiamine-phosphate kinase [Hyphomicrobiales bacterium]|nr:thiamine-phosphate kinase [Hyphomicrobiales bacterium]
MGASREHDLIARYFAPLAGPEGLGLLDDAALLAPRAGHEWVITTDALVAGVHFFADDPAEIIAGKALRVNLSDLAAKGARPRAFTLALMLPQGLEPGWFEGFAKGLGADMARFGIALIGGDTVATTGPLALTITAFGEVGEGRMVTRSGAVSGDAIYVSGTIGDAALGLVCLKSPDRLALAARHRRHLEARYHRPEPRMALGAALRTHAHAAMDVSDGLVGDLGRLLAASGQGGIIEAAAVPFSPAVHAALSLEPTLEETALTGGDDYEIISCVPPHACSAFEQDCARAGVKITRIGVVQAHRLITWRAADGSAMSFASPAYSHL